jgi:hypothetical protein
MAEATAQGSVRRIILKEGKHQDAPQHADNNGYLLLTINTSWGYFMLAINRRELNG